MPSVADMDEHQAAVAPALAIKTTANTTKKTR
jgi:hypothetical protein